MVELDFNKINQQAAQEGFFALRGHAIEAYAGLEHSLCQLFSVLLGANFKDANIVFFGINSARSRGEILENLYSQKFKGAYPEFWNSFKTAVIRLTGMRNKIVHWTTVTDVHVNEESGEFRGISLTNSNLININEKEKDIFKKDIVEFIDKCQFVSLKCIEFAALLSGQWKSDPAYIARLETQFSEEIKFPK